MKERDLETSPYSPDEKRVVDWLWDHGTGGGDDPIGFVLASISCALAQRNALREGGDRILSLISRISDQATADQRAEHARLVESFRQIWNEAKI